MPKIEDLIKAAKSKDLTISDCIDVLKSSEGVKANAIWTVEGHPLQHSNQDTSGSGRRLEDEYHFRGPLPIEKQLKGGPNVGMYKAAIKIETDGSFTPKSNTFHSQFQDDFQAGMCLKLLLQSSGGIWALELLNSNPRVSVTVTLGMPGGTEFFEREAQLVAVGTPTTNLIPQAAIEGVPPDPRNFVMIHRRDMNSVVATLRSKDSPLAHLHVQTLYPTVDALPPGSTTVDVAAKTPADYSGPAGISFT
jgi:hypothetical protein